MKKLLYSVIFAFVTLFIQNVSAQIPTNGLVGKYTFTGNANDEIGTNHATTFGDGTMPDIDYFGNTNSAYHFSGWGNSYIQMNNTTQFGSNDFTISFWYKKASSTTGSKGLINNLNGATGFSIGFSGNTLQYYVGGATSGSRGGSGGTPTLNEWHNVALVHTSTVTRLYLNGTEVSSTTNTINGGVNGSNIIIAKSGSEYFFGSFDNLFIYNRALNQTEITELYTTTETCNINIPNVNFKNYLINNASINTNGDNQIQCSEAENFTGTIDCSSLNITDFAGLEKFINITGLNVSNNNLTSINVTANTAITSLNVAHNNLTSLNITSNTALASLQCNDNQLQFLNIGNGNNTNFTHFLAQNNPALTCIYVDDATYSTTNWTGANFQKDANASYCDNNCVVNVPDANFKNKLLAISAINTNGDSEIQCTEAALFTGSLNVFGSQIADLTGIEAFPNITQLYIGTNWLSGNLDLSNNTALTYIHANTNNITSLNLGNNTVLNELQVNNNQLNSLDVSNNNGLTIISANNNQLTSLDISNNPSVTQVSAANNQLTSVNLANGNNTNFTLVNLQNNPANLFCIKVDNTAYSTANWIGTNFLKPAGAVWSEDCSQYSCIVNIPNANFKNALLSHNPVIDTNGDGHIQCSEATAYTGALNLFSKNINNLTGIEAFTNISLLDIGLNPVGGNLDLSNNNSITELNAGASNISSLNLGNNPVIRKIVVTQCLSLQSLDVSNNPSVNYIHAYLTGLTSLNVANGNNVNFILLQTEGANLTCIQVDNAAYSNTNWTGAYFAKPAGAVYSENCSAILPVSDISKKGINIYPNPATDYIILKNKNHVNIKIFDQSGNLINSKQIIGERVDISSLPSGIYYIETSSGLKSKFIKK